MDDLILKPADGIAAKRSQETLVQELLKRGLARQLPDRIELADKGAFNDRAGEADQPDPNGELPEGELKPDAEVSGTR